MTRHDFFYWLITAAVVLGSLAIATPVSSEEGEGYQKMANGTLFQPENSDRVFWVDEGKARYIAHADVLHGVFDGKIHRLELTIDRGDDVVEGTRIVGVHEKRFLIDRQGGGHWKQRYIPSMDVFNAMSFRGGGTVADWSSEELAGYPIGSAFK